MFSGLLPWCLFDERTLAVRDACQVQQGGAGVEGCNGRKGKPKCGRLQRPGLYAEASRTACSNDEQCVQLDVLEEAIETAERASVDPTSIRQGKEKVKQITVDKVDGTHRTYFAHVFV